MNVLVVDVGGTNVKILATGQNDPRKFPSGPTLTPQDMVDGVRKLAGDWKYEAVSIGYPGLVSKGRIAVEPRNLGPGWQTFDFEAAFNCPVKLMNDAAMQALGSYKSGLLLFVGLGTGLGSALVKEGIVVPMELGHLPYRKGNYEDYVGRRGLERRGKKKWGTHVAFSVGRLIEVFHPDDVVLGGGNAKKLKEVPRECRLGGNAYAFLGGFRLWQSVADSNVALPDGSVAAEQGKDSETGNNARPYVQGGHRPSGKKAGRAFSQALRR
ncbi:MAG: ROK family protein [Rhodopila sp.]|nr:ROK family protein [Rhodopila sp.]